MSFLDAIDKKDKRQMKRHRLPLCPFPSNCLPVSYHVDDDGAGVCSGLIHKSDNLDCIRLCNFYRDLNTKEIKYGEHFMTPTEALDVVHSLSMAVRSSLDYTTSYQKYYKELCDARDKGDKTPSQY